MDKEEIKRIRLELGMTRPQLAERLYVSDRTIRRWEVGDKPISGPAILALELLEERHYQLERDARKFYAQQAARGPNAVPVGACIPHPGRKGHMGIVGLGEPIPGQEPKTPLKPDPES